MLLVRRDEVLKRVGDDMYRAEGGLSLTWLRTWDTDAPLLMSELDPFFIEVCRRVRLTATAKGRHRGALAAGEHPARGRAGAEGQPG